MQLAKSLCNNLMNEYYDIMAVRSMNLKILRHQKIGMEFMLQLQIKMSLKKIRVLPDQYIFKQNDKGNTAYLVISGGLVAELDNKKIGKIETGEIFGELSLILGENRTCSIKAAVPTEVIEIKKALEEILLSSNLELHKVIKICLKN